MQLRYIIAGVLAILILYGFIRAIPLIAGPEIRLDPITMNSDQGFMTLSGRALHTQTLTLDGSTLLIDQDGQFSKMLTLPRGAQTITLTAHDQFGRTTTLTREIVTP
jgi:hypothetical protein